MEFTSRGKNNMQNHPATGGGNHQRRHRLGLGVKFMRVEIFTMFLGVALLLAAVAVYAGFSSPGAESKQISSKEYQAIFLGNGQVYFGKVKELNNNYMVLTNIFYIENNASSPTSASAQNTNYTLRKLGTTELHAPQDKMIINRDSITFWENLKDSSQVVTKINEYYKNPEASATTPSNSTNQQTTVPTTTTPTTNITQ